MLSQLLMPAQPGRLRAAFAFENGGFWTPPWWSRITNERTPCSARSFLALVRKLRAEQGVRSFVILLHQGGVQNPPFSNANAALNLPGWAGINNCDNMSGEIVAIANGLDDQVDVIVSGHTHAQYNCSG